MTPPKSILNQDEHLLAAILDELKEIRADNHEHSEQILNLLGAQTLILQSIADALAPEPSTVSAAIAFGGSTMPTPGTLAVGSTLQASFVGLLADGTVNTATTVSTAPTWSSDNASVATVDSNGLVTGVGAGSATITATGGSFTDADGTVVGPLDASNTVSDTAPVARTVSAAVAFA